MEHRDRAAGWKHAKVSGHKNEDLVKDRLDNDSEFQYSFLRRVSRPHQSIVSTAIGGIHEKSVPGINGNKTKSKTDLKVYLDNGEIINVSIKKSLGGQVYLIRAGIFIDTFEKQFGAHIPDSVKRAINLFWASADDAVQIIDQYSDKSNSKDYNLQIRHKSLNAATLENYSTELYHDMLNWFADNAYNLAKLSFSAGAALDQNEWSDFVWYINFLDENDVDDIFNIEDVCTAVQRAAAKETYYGSVNGGTTIQLPFGFVQWHQKKLQFRHDYDKLCNLPY